MISYWEQQSFTQYQHIIIGAGIVGMSTALELRNKYPKDSILILERGLMATGASSRNAGFACMGSLSELLADLETMDEETVVSLFAARKEGLQLLRSRLGDEAIGYAENGSYELLNKEQLGAIEKIDYLNELLYPINNQPTFASANEKIESFGFAAAHCHALIENLCEGEIDTGKMLRSLCTCCIENNIEIKTGAAVSHYEEAAKEVLVFVPDALRQSVWQLRCHQLYLCTNAFSSQLLPSFKITPARGQVLITNELPALPFRGTFHFDEGFYYFRTINNRLLLGGGRNIDFETETSDILALHTGIQNHLEKLIADLILPNTPFEIEQRWSGIMGFAESKKPIVQIFSERVSGAFGMGGMGVALGSAVAKQLVAFREI